MPTDTTTDAERFAYGSVQDYAATIRDNAADSHDTYVEASAIVGAIADCGHLSETERLARIRNVLAAAKQVREEMRAP